jgi:hypothetical protein
VAAVDDYAEDDDDDDDDDDDEYDNDNNDLSSRTMWLSRVCTVTRVT